jgi:hypothetical protein
LPKTRLYVNMGGSVPGDGLDSRVPALNSRLVSRYAN